MENALYDFKSKNENNKQFQCLNVISKLLTNIHKNPTEPKYRAVQRGNPTIKSKILDNPGGEALLISCGFAFDDTSFIFYDEETLSNTLHTIDAEKETSELSILTHEAKEKKLLIQSEQRKFKEQKEKAQHEKKLISMKMKLDRQEKAHQPKTGDLFAEDIRFKPNPVAMSMENMMKLMPPIPRR